MPKINSFPNNQDEYIGAEVAMHYLYGRTSGVFGANNNASVKAVVGEMAVTVSDGNGWMSNDSGYGVGWWFDEEKRLNRPIKLNVDLADGVLDRIDRVVISWETTNYVALPDLMILKGTPSSKAVPPTLTNNNLVRQISLAQISVKAGTDKLTQAMITDERLDPKVCGIVTESIKIDTTMFNSQAQEMIKTLDNTIKEGQKTVNQAVEVQKQTVNKAIEKSRNDLNLFKAKQTNEFTTWFESVKGQLGTDAAGNLLNLININIEDIANLFDMVNNNRYLSYISDSDDVIIEDDDGTPILADWKYLIV